MQQEIIEASLQDPSAFSLAPSQPNYTAWFALVLSTGSPMSPSHCVSFGAISTDCTAILGIPRGRI